MLSFVLLCLTYGSAHVASESDCKNFQTETILTYLSIYLVDHVCVDNYFYGNVELLQKDVYDQFSFN